MTQDVLKNAATLIGKKRALDYSASVNSRVMEELLMSAEKKLKEAVEKDGSMF